MSIRPLLVAQRELKLFLADRGDLAFSIVLPVAMLALMLAAFGGGAAFNGTGYVVDRDGGPFARRFVERLEQSPGLAVKLLSPTDAERRLDRSSILLYTEIPPGFSDDLAAGRPATVVHHQRGTGGDEGQIVGAYVEATAAWLTSQMLLRAETERLLAVAGVPASPEAVEAAVSQTLAETAAAPPVAVARVEIEQQDLAQIMFPRILTWFVLFAVTINAQALVRERRRGTLERLLATRLTRGEFYLGTLLGNVLRGLVQLAVFFLLAAVAFDFFTVRSFALSFAFAVLVVLAAGGIGMVIAMLCRSENQAMWSAVFVTMAMTVFGGTFGGGEPGGLLGTIGRGTINYWANRGFDRLIEQGAGLSAIAPSIAVLAVTAAVAVLAGRLLFRRVGGVA